MDVQVYCVNSFINNNPDYKQSGNPAGVVLHAEHLNTQQMQYIATQVGYSETAFVSERVQISSACDFNIRFFTPNHEVDFCGHATLAAFHTLFEQNIIKADEYTQQTKAGKLAVKVTADGLVTMNQALPQFKGVVDSNEVADLLNIPKDIFTSTRLPCEIISTGLADLIIPIPTGILDSVIPDHHKISAFSKKYNVIGLHLFELQKAPSKITASCRNFAPLFGINEESATGSACGALACYLHKHNVVETDTFTFEQGRIMESPSMLQAFIKHKEDVITQVKVSGFASLINIKKEYRIEAQIKVN